MGSHKLSWGPFILGTAFFALLLMGVFGNQGCTSKMPMQSVIVATATPTLSPSIISNLDDGSLKLNSVSFPEGVWYASTWGDPGNKVNSSWVSCGGVGAVGTDCAIHLFGRIMDNADGQYPSFQLECILSNGYFDASAFRGLRFYYKIPNDDKPVNPPAAGESALGTGTRRFNFVIAATQQDIKGGTCPSNCFDHFGAFLNGTSGAWVQETYWFSSAYGTPTMSRQGWGYPTGLTTLTPAALKQAIELQWQVGRNGSKGRYDVDYWVDQVEFL